MRGYDWIDFWLLTGIVAVVVCVWFSLELLA